MKKLTALSLAAAIGLQATTIGDLFDRLKRQPQIQLDAMQAKYAELGVKKVEDGFYPTVSLFASYEHYNSPTNLRPMSPVESAVMTQEHKPLPFANTIERLGAKGTLPIFVKELFSLRKKAQESARSAKAKKRLNYLQNEALLLGADASWRHLKALEAALKARMRSIEKTREDTRIKVESGRAPGVALDKLDEGLNRLAIALNDLRTKETTLRARIEALTGTQLDAPVPLTAKRGVREGEIFALKPLEHLVEARRHGIEASKDRLYPKVAASAMWSENYGQNAVSFNNANDDVHRGYGNYMVALSMPLFEKSAYTGIEQAEVALRKEQLRLAKTRQELSAQAAALRRTLELTRRSRELADRSVANQKNLLAYAKVAYETGRMTEEEYLRYEEGLFDAQSKVAEADAVWWQTLAQLAVIYGDDLRDIVE